MVRLVCVASLTDVISSSTTIVGYLTVFTDDIFVKCKNGGEKGHAAYRSSQLSFQVRFWSRIYNSFKKLPIAFFMKSAPIIYVHL